MSHWLKTNFFCSEALKKVALYLITILKKERNNSKLSSDNAVRRLEEMFKDMPIVDNVKITSMEEATIDKVRFNGVMSYFTENVRMRGKNKDKRYKNGSLKTFSREFPGSSRETL